MFEFKSVKKQVIREFKDGQVVRETTTIEDGGSGAEAETRLKEAEAKLDKASKHMNNMFDEMNKMFKELF